MKYAFVILIIGAFLEAGKVYSAESVVSAQNSESRIDTLYKYYFKGEYFQLRERLRNLPNPDVPRARFLSAVVLNAFNKPEQSNRVIAELLRSNSALPETLVNELHSLKLDNHFSLYEYHDAFIEARYLQAAPGNEAEDMQTSSLLRALADIPAQRVSVKNKSILPMRTDRAGLRRIPVSINGRQRSYVLDTGASHSAIMESEAEKLGLKMIEIDFEIGTSTGKKVQADVAVAEKLVIGNAVYSHVVFVVLSDEALSFQSIDYRIPGIIGMNIIEALGEIRFSGNDLVIPVSKQTRSLYNMAFGDRDLLASATIRIPEKTGDLIQDSSVICQLDTGNGVTDLLVPFYHNHRMQIEKSGKHDVVENNGVGSKTESRAYRFPEVQVRIGGEVANLKDIPVLTEGGIQSEKFPLECNIGLDLISQFHTVIMNFHSMSIVLNR